MWSDEAGLTAAAQALATQALPVFFAGLPLVVIFAACAWWMARRYAVPQGQSRLSLQVQLVIALGICLMIVIAAVTMFASIACEIGPGEELSRLDQAFSDAIGQTVSTCTQAVFAAVTHLGDRLTLTALGIAVAIALVVRGERWLALGWVVAIGGNAVVNPILKSVFERAPRCTTTGRPRLPRASPHTPARYRILPRLQGSGHPGNTSIYGTQEYPAYGAVHGTVAG